MHKTLLATSLILFTGCALVSTGDTDESLNIENKTVSKEFNFKTIRTGLAAEEVLIASPKQGAKITSPLSIKGKAPGYWFFEATAPIKIVNWEGLMAGEGFIQAQGNWMTEELVTFEGAVEFELPEDLQKNNGWVIFRRHNASGLPEHDSAVEVPIQFSQE